MIHLALSLRPVAFLLQETGPRVMNSFVVEGRPSLCLVLLSHFLEIGEGAFLLDGLGFRALPLARIGHVAFDERIF